MWLLKEREKRGLSQAKLAQLTRIGQANLSAWELGKAEVPHPIEEKLRKFFELFDKEYDQSDRSELFSKTKWSKHYKNSKLIKKPIRTAIKKEKVVDFIKRKFSKVVMNLDNKNPQALTAVSLFAGCGGLSLGFQNAGFNIKGHVEIEDSMNDIFNANFPYSEEIGRDITRISDIAVANFKSRVGKIDVLIGGPPCQGFSLTGNRNVNDERNMLYKHFVRFTKILEPSAIVLENVRLLLSMKHPNGGLVVAHIVREFEGIGYNTDYHVLNAQDYGVPQFRERVFIVGYKKELGIKKIEFPRPTHGQDDAPLFYRKRRYQTFRDATGDLQYLESGEASADDPLHFAVAHPTHVLEMLKDIPEGKSAHKNPNPDLRPKSGYNTTYKRLYWDEPSSTISTTFGMISGSRNVHPQATRSLTIREAMRCQTFPDTFIVFGKLGQIRTMIGNAVPPLLGESVANDVKSIIWQEGSK